MKEDQNKEVSLNEEKITTKKEYVDEINQFLISYIKEKCVVGDVILSLNKEFKNNSYLSTSLNNWEENDLYYDFWSEIPIFELIDENSELGKSFKTNNKKKFELNELEGMCDYLTSQGYIKKEEISSTNDKWNKTTIIINYIVTTKPFLESSQTNTIFYAMEFNNQITKDFFNKLKNKIKEKLPFFEVIMLADEQAKLNFSTNINNRIQNDIKMCRFFIADLTSKDNEHKYLNPNVMYEVGLANAYYKEPIYIAYKDPFNDPQNLPFDIRNHSVNYYSSEPLEQEALIEKIIESMKSSLNAND